MKIPMAYFTELEQEIQKFIWNYKDQIASGILRKKKKSEVLRYLIIKLYYKAIVIKIE